MYFWFPDGDSIKGGGIAKVEVFCVLSILYSGFLKIL